MGSCKNLESHILESIRLKLIGSEVGLEKSDRRIRGNEAVSRAEMFVKVFI